MEAVKFLYDKFLLRDAFGKMVPGYITVISLSIYMTGLTLIEVITISTTFFSSWYILVVLGISWIAGFIPQEVGSWWKKRRGILATEVDSEVLLNSVKGCVEDTDEQELKDLKQLRERQVVIKEATGNLSLSLVFLFLACLTYAQGSQVFNLVVVLLLPALILWIRHRFQAKRQHEIDTRIGEITNVTAETGTIPQAA